MIKEKLSGKRIAITGATGFLGTALVERLLSSVPDCELPVSYTHLTLPTILRV